MKLEDKKFLAEWMDIDLRYARTNGEWIFVNQHKNAVSWNPDINHEQFKEVLEHLSEKQQDEVWYLLWRTKSQELDSKNHNMITIWVWIANHKVEVMDAVMEVIKDDR